MCICSNARKFFVPSVACTQAKNALELIYNHLQFVSHNYRHAKLDYFECSYISSAVRFISIELESDIIHIVYTQRTKSKTKNANFHCYVARSIQVQMYFVQDFLTLPLRFPQTASRSLVSSHSPILFRLRFFASVARMF